MKIETIKLDVTGATPEELARYKEVLFALMYSGGLTGVKGGKTIIHFDGKGDFMGIELDYWPYRKRSNENR